VTTPRRRRGFSSRRSAPILDYPATILADGPLAYFRFEESAAATVCADSSGHAYDAVYSSGKVDVAGLLTIGGRGMNTRVTCSSIPMSNAIDAASSFSIECLVKPDASNPNNSGIVARFGGSPDWLLWFDTGGKLSMRWYNDSGGSTDLVGPTWAIGTQYHVIATYTSGAQQLIVNGSVVATGTLTGDLKNSGQAVYLHDYQDFWDMSGTLDEVSLWTRVLTPTEVANHYSLI
jgi:hypothetical protein